MSWVAVSAVAAGVMAAGTVYNIDATRKANNQAKDRAKAQQLAADEANNKANAKAPNSAALLRDNLLAGGMGQSGTMLTGPQGLGSDDLKLGKNSLLGNAANVLYGPPGG